MSVAITIGPQLLIPSEYVEAADLKRKVAPVTITQVEVSELRMQGGKSQKKPIIHFKGTNKKLVLNKTNAKSIAKVLGTGVCEEWVGKQIILYPTTTRCGGEEVDCVRVRERVPAKQAAPVDDGQFVAAN
jgi:hypothetical protein